ncbi:hypothetical protein GCM10011385_17550 [Nitratireductor aestuarii]|jgi:PBP1b-binding outer membrane lipoprotein LpoB|uniref:Outer membrane lipoprotein n=1 Tax=Nitratireductor aestuarii TaxID=1735103 RepID=A0A916RNU2_9HYPH|nr:hypothetical protein [Nitratireductor aestuarii]GGA64201.1 hypothetical protein GCM10011385_17550 [Nitratireductor aestuarii]
MKLNFRHAAYLAMASTLVISGCVSAPQGGYGPAGNVRASSPVEGQWSDTQGVAISTFSGGAFQSVATDTGNKLSEGTYRQVDANNIEISMTSLIRQTQMRVNCTLATPSQLNCTNAGGQNFSLIRRG